MVSCSDMAPRKWYPQSLALGFQGERNRSLLTLLRLGLRMETPKCAKRLLRDRGYGPVLREARAEMCCYRGRELVAVLCSNGYAMGTTPPRATAGNGPAVRLTAFAEPFSQSFNVP
jgi:hypothetical protein